MPTTRRISRDPALLGESPVWDAEHGHLYWVDGVSRLVHRHDPADDTHRSWPTPSTVGSIALTREPGTLVAALVDGVVLLGLQGAELRPLFRPEPADPRLRFNDGKAARDGAFVCGSMGIHADPVGAFYRIGPDGAARAFAEGIGISNAVCFSPDGRTLYFADSISGMIRAIDYEPGTGPVGASRPVIDAAVHGSGPDGATVDADGCLWVALIRSGRIGRFTPDGRLDRIVEAPTDLPSSLAFGGPDLRTLFVTSIKDSGSGRAVSRHPDGGHLFAIEGLGTQGLPEPRFGASG